MQAAVEIARDASGIPHITASSEHDLYVAQGFVHAQDRLWQMESIRRLTQGRLAEVAGEQAVAMDYLSRAIGLRELRQRAFAGVSPEQRAWLEAYAEGVNAYLRMRGRDLPLEFRSMGFVPEPWQPEDCLSILPTMAWGLAYPAYAEELFALARGSSFTEAQWNDLFPVAPGARVPPESYFSTVARWKLGSDQSRGVRLPSRHAGLALRRGPREIALRPARAGERQQQLGRGSGQRRSANPRQRPAPRHLASLHVVLLPPQRAGKAERRGHIARGLPGCRDRPKRARGLGHDEHHVRCRRLLDLPRGSRGPHPLPGGRSVASDAAGGHRHQAAEGKVGEPAPVPHGAGPVFTAVQPGARPWLS